MARPVKPLEQEKQKIKMSLEQVKNQVNNALKLYREGNKPELQRQLYELYLNFNRYGGGNLIIKYPQKDKLAECFTLMLMFDWMNDNDIREVWAENGFYCIIEHINTVKTHAEQMPAGLVLFRHLLHGGSRHLAPKVANILIKARQKDVFTFSDCMLASPFDNNDYNKGAEYVILQFSFLSAQIIRPMVTGHDIGLPILSANEKKAFDALLGAGFYDLDAVSLFNKARFIKRIIGSVLEDL